MPVSYTHLDVYKRQGWMYLAPATILIFIMSFWPIIQAVITSFKTGSSANMQLANPLTYNYTRMFQDAVFKRSIGNTFLYLIIEVPIMLVLAILLAQLLNNKHLKFKGLFRTCVFLPCATSLVSYALIFKSLFATQGLINTIPVSYTHLDVYKRQVVLINRIFEDDVIAFGDK